MPRIVSEEEKMQKLTITIKPILLKELKRIAEQERKSLSSVLNSLLEETLFEKKKKKSGIRVLEIVEKNYVTEENVALALEELRKLRKESDRW